MKFIIILLIMCVLLANIIFKALLFVWLNKVLNGFRIFFYLNNSRPDRTEILNLHMDFG